jgi:predicted GNAT family N-acyltransferase
LPTTTDEFVRFGRLSVSAQHRNHGYGNKAVQEIFNWIMHSEYKHHPIQIAAQTHLIKMYEKCGFVCHGEVFHMGTLPHIRMNHQALV